MKTTVFILFLCAAMCGAQTNDQAYIQASLTQITGDRCDVIRLNPTNTFNHPFIFAQVTNSSCMEIAITAEPSRYWRTTILIISNAPLQSMPATNPPYRTFSSPPPTKGSLVYAFEENTNQALQEALMEAEVYKWLREEWGREAVERYKATNDPPYKHWTPGVLQTNGGGDPCPALTTNTLSPRTDDDEVFKAVEQYIATNQTSIKWPLVRQPPWTVKVINPADHQPLLILNNVIAIIPNHEPSCHLVRYVQDGRTNEFHAWQVSLEVTKWP